MSNKDLITRLRAWDYNYMYEAADLIEAQEKRIAELTNKAFNLAVERDDMRAELGDLPEAQNEMLTTIKRQREHIAELEAIVEHDLRTMQDQHKRIVELESKAAEHRDGRLAALERIAEYQTALAAPADDVVRDAADLLCLQKFMDSVFGEFPEHGDVDGFTLQDIAQECGLLVEQRVEIPCGENCACAENGVDGEGLCYRVQPVMKRARRAAALATKEKQNG
jgi:hypothetical protein